MSGQAEKILLADDEHDILMLVNFQLQRAGYQVLLAENGREALEIAQREQPALVILDRMMPEMDGVEVCKRLRQSNPDIYVIMLTAMGTEDQRVVGLEAGADDYISKPFNGRELVLRVKAMLRRSQQYPDKTAAEKNLPNTNAITPRPVIEPNGIFIDPERRQVWKDGKEIELTKLEFDLLKFLFDNPGLVFSRDRLLERVWNYDYFGDERVVDVHMARLRKKLEDDPTRPRYIQTIRGVGYKYTS
ncbi:MAG: response regulator transcription factor [Chloroflexota bacterium]|nr:response regulator transcription factor [Chloroflexota bacterium]